MDSQEKLKSALSQIIEAVGEDPKREGLRDTPRRFAKSMEFLTSGYRMDLKKVIGSGIFSSHSSEIVLVRDIELFSLCEHHVLPFWGKAHVAYIPNGKIIGLSKIARIVDMFSRRLQVQEHLTHEIAKTLQEVLNPHGVGVILEAYHLCMMMRGVEKQNSKTVTSAMLGDFRKNEASRKELLALLSGFSLRG